MGQFCVLAKQLCTVLILEDLIKARLPEKNFGFSIQGHMIFADAINEEKHYDRSI